MPVIRGNDRRARNVRCPQGGLAITSHGAKLDIVMAHEHEHEHPKAAPDELDHIRQFVNTLDVESLGGETAERAGAATCLASRGLLAEADALTAGDVRQAQEM